MTEEKDLQKHHQQKENVVNRRDGLYGRRRKTTALPELRTFAHGTTASPTASVLEAKGGETPRSGISQTPIPHEEDLVPSTTSRFALRVPRMSENETLAPRRPLKSRLVLSSISSSISSSSSTTDSPGSKATQERTKPSVTEKLKSKLRSQARDRELGPVQAAKLCVPSSGINASVEKEDPKYRLEKVDPDDLEIDKHGFDENRNAPRKNLVVAKSISGHNHNDDSDDEVFGSSQAVGMTSLKARHSSGIPSAPERSEPARDENAESSGVMSEEDESITKGKRLARIESRSRTSRLSRSSRFPRLQHRALSLNTRGRTHSTGIHPSDGGTGLDGSRSAATTTRGVFCEFGMNNVTESSSDLKEIPTIRETGRIKRRLGSGKLSVWKSESIRHLKSLTDAGILHESGSKIGGARPEPGGGGSAEGCVVERGSCCPGWNVVWTMQGRVKELEARLRTSEDRLANMLTASEKQEELIASELPRVEQNIRRHERSQDVQYQSLLDVLADNFRTIGHVETRFEQLAMTRHSWMESSSAGVTRKLVWSVLDILTTCIIYLLHALSGLHKAGEYARVLCHRKLAQT